MNLYPARDWIHRIYSLLEMHGSRLAEDLAAQRIGDNCRLADEILDRLVDDGWIDPLTYSPTASQKFFGVGGRGPGVKHRSPAWRGSHTYPQEWRFRARLDSDGLNAFVRTQM